MSICITGANRGIGLQLARDYAASGQKVIAACRNASPELKALSNVRVVEGVDTGSDEGVRRLADAIKGEPVSVLINNAGILAIETVDEMSFDSMLKQYNVNSLGPLRTTLALLGNLGPGSKVAVITSRMGSIADNSSGSYYGYRASKAAVNSIFASLALDLKSKGIAVGIIHPGMVATDMTARYGHNGCISTEESSKGIRARMEELSLHNSGTFWHQNGSILPW